MKCGFCNNPLASLDTMCDCGQDPNAGALLHHRYQLLGLVGQGGMGMIYRALDQANQNKLCAIKISRWSEALQQLRQLEPEAAKAEEQQRIEREFKLLQKAASQSTHIVQVFDSFHVDPRLGLFYPMEFLNGQSLAGIPEWGTPMPPKQVLELILQLCEGVGVAHGLGVAHRDLNPENVFVVSTPEHERFIKLIDFGIARDLYARKGIYNTGSDLAFGHLQYLSPEQVGYDPVTDEYQQETAARLDHRADIYSIGAIMFHMLTGHPPFADTTLEGLAVRNWRKPPNLAHAIKTRSLPIEIQELILSCLQPAPDLRLPDILALSDLLQRCLNNHDASEHALDSLENSTTNLEESDKILGNFDEGSWEFPAIKEPTWNLPSLEDVGFSEEFDAMFADHSSKSPETKESFDKSSGEQETSPSNPTPPEAKEPPAPSSSPSSPAVHSTSPQPESPASVPSGVWEALDNAPSFLDFKEVTPNSNNHIDVVFDHKQMNVQEFFGDFGEIVEESGGKVVTGGPSYYALPQRSPKLEALLSKDNLQNPTEEKSSDDISSSILASELLDAFEEITFDEEPAQPQQTRWSSPKGSLFPSRSDSAPNAQPTPTRPSAQDIFGPSTPAPPSTSSKVHDIFSPSEEAPTSQPNLDFSSNSHFSSIHDQKEESNTWIWILIAVLVVAAGAGGYFFFFSS